MRVWSYKIDGRRYAKINHKLDPDGRRFSTSATFMPTPGNYRRDGPLIAVELHVAFDGRTYTIQLEPDEAQQVHSQFDQYLGKRQ